MRKIKIGIGIISYRREECLKLFMDQLEKYPPYFPYERVLSLDNPHISKAKNECLHTLFESGCDYVFLFEDDCYVKDKWWDLPFVRCGHEYSLYMNDAYTKIGSGNEYSYYNDCSGVFMFLSKETFRKVGYFNESYEYNGLEHIGYSARLRRAVGDPGYYCLDNTKKFIHSIDLDGNKEFNVFHRSTMEGLRGKALQLNQEVLTKELNNENLYYGSSISDKLVQ